jgi:hypothetical protein
MRVHRCKPIQARLLAHCSHCKCSFLSGSGLSQGTAAMRCERRLRTLQAIHTSSECSSRILTVCRGMRSREHKWSWNSEKSSSSALWNLKRNIDRIRTIRGIPQVARTDSAINHMQRALTQCCDSTQTSRLRVRGQRHAVLTRMPYSRQPPPCCVHAVVSLQLERLDHQCLQPVFRNQ